MATEDRARKSPWDAPAATALTDSESRADQADIWMQNLNGPAIS